MSAIDALLNQILLILSPLNNEETEELLEKIRRAKLASTPRVQLQAVPMDEDALKKALFEDKGFLAKLKKEFLAETLKLMEGRLALERAKSEQKAAAPKQEKTQEKTVETEQKKPVKPLPAKTRIFSLKIVGLNNGLPTVSVFPQSKRGRVCHYYQLLSRQDLAELLKNSYWRAAFGLAMTNPVAKLVEQKDLLCPSCIAEDLEQFNPRKFKQKYFLGNLGTKAKGLIGKRASPICLNLSMAWQLIKEGCSPPLVNQIAGLEDVEQLKPLYEAAEIDFSADSIDSPSDEGQLRTAIDKVLEGVREGKAPEVKKVFSREEAKTKGQEYAIPEKIPLEKWLLKPFFDKVFSSWQDPGLRNRIGAFLLLFRPPELVCQLKASEVDLAARTVTIKKDKVPLPSMLVKLLEAHLAALAEENEEWLFPSQEVRLGGQRTPVQPRAVEAWFQALNDGPATRLLCRLNFVYQLIETDELGMDAVRLLTGLPREKLLSLYELAGLPARTSSKEEFAPWFLSQVLDRTIQEILNQSPPSPEQKRLTLSNGTKLLTDEELKAFFREVQCGPGRNQQTKRMIQLAFSPLSEKEVFRVRPLDGNGLVMKAPRFLRELLIEEIPLPLLALDGDDCTVPLVGDETTLTQAVQEILDKLGLEVKATPSFLRDQYLAFMARALCSPAKLAMIVGIAPHGLKELYFEPQRRGIGSWDERFLQDVIKKESIKEVMTQAENALAKLL